IALRALHSFPTRRSSDLLTSNWYGGFNIGQSRESINDGAIANSELGGGLTGITDDHEDNGYKVFAGYQFNDHIALEAGYFDLGRSEEHTSELQSRENLVC